jgi:AcrR family transcriptional regulator
MGKRKDRRIQRTRQLLRGALFSLIQEKGFEPLSVQDIIDRANVGRATFYAHFENKEDLLLSGFDALRESLRERHREALSRGSSVDERIFAFSHDMLAHVNEHLSTLLACKLSAVLPGEEVEGERALASVVGFVLLVHKVPDCLQEF